MLIFTLLSSFILAYISSHHYAQTNNKSSLKEISQLIQHSRKEVEEDIRYLVSDLIYMQTQTNKVQNNFLIYGVIQKDTQEIFSIQPHSYKQKFQNLTFPYDRLKHFPIAFFSIPWTSKKRQILFLVDVDQIQKSFLPKNLSHNKILFGVPSSKKLAQISKTLIGGGFTEAFILDNKQNILPIHSNTSYSGQPFKKNLFTKLAKKHKTEWLYQADKEGLLTAGIKMTIAGAYLVFNKKMYHWQNYYWSSWNQFWPAMLILGMLIFIALFLLTRPLLTSYEYLIQMLRHYAISKKFPVPNSTGKNTYILSALPWLKRIYWMLREEKLSPPTDSSPSIYHFSNMIQQLVQKMKTQYPNIQTQLYLNEDISISNHEKGLKQAFSEFLKNAVECMNYKGKIDIHTSKEDQVFYCRIRDYGPGMNSDVMNQACSAYYSSKSTASGLGLTLAHSALSQVGGQIQFSNALDGKSGLIVQISLPLNLLKTSDPGLRL